jgi:hypothetical protein
MKSASDNIPAIYMYAESWISGTRELTPLQRGIYWDLIAYAQLYGAKGLPYDIVKLQRLVLLCNPDDLEDWEKQKKDLYYVLQKKWEVRKNEEDQDAYFNNRHWKEYEIARKKKESVIKSNEKYNKKRKPNNEIVTISSDSDSDNDNDISINKKAKLFDTFWQLNKNKIQVGNAKKAWVKLSAEWVQKPEKLAELYNNHFQNKKDYAQHPASWLNSGAYLDQKEETYNVQPEKSYKDYVWFVKKGMRSTRISDDMVRQMRKENLITEEEFKRW